MKTTTRKKIYLTLLLMLAAVGSPAQVVINELMQSNIDCVMDDRNEFPDSWVELYNKGIIAMDLSLYSIGLSDNPDEAWTLPRQYLPPKSRTLVYCDKENVGMHAPFRLESGKGGSVYLFYKGQVEDKVVELPKQPAPNIAYGRRTDGEKEWGYMAVPTPKEANCGETCKDILGDPVFSHHGQVVQVGHPSIRLQLSVPEGSPEGTEIRYTFDGSEPTQSSPLYQGALTVASTRVIRAKCFCAGWLSPRSRVESFIFFPREMTLPVVSILTDNKYLNDQKIGIYVDGNYSSTKRNYEYNWRRPANFELFVGLGDTSVINQLCETRIQGGATRGSKLKSQAFYAHKRFGKKRFKYEFFPDQKPGLDTYKSIILRNAGNDFDYLYMRDAIVQRSVAQHVDLDWQAWRPAVVYINGIYKGILNIRERSNEDNIWTNYDHLEDIDMVENWSELKAGTMDNWKEFQAFYNEHGHTWDEYEEWMDCHEFINIMVMNLYFNNQDFPGNNIVFWRPRAEGGRWRVVAKDTDYSLGLYGTSSSVNSIAWINDPNYDPNHAWANGHEHTRLFRRLMEDETFQREFLDRAAIYVGDFLNFDGTWAVWEPMYEAIKTEYPNHRKLINQWWPNYNEELSQAKNWLKSRTNYFYKYLSDYYNVGKPVKFTINKAVRPEDLPYADIEVNGVPLSTGVFDGQFFINRAVTLQAHPHDGRGVTGWNVVQTSTNGSVKMFGVEGDTYTFFMPDCKSLSITARFGVVDAIADITESSPDAPAAIYDIRGIRQSRLHKGLNIVRGANGKVYKVIQ